MRRGQFNKPPACQCEQGHPATHVLGASLRPPPIQPLADLTRQGRACQCRVTLDPCPNAREGDVGEFPSGNLHTDMLANRLPGVQQKLWDKISLNAAGRLQDMTIGIQALLTDDGDKAQALAEQLDGINHERRTIEAIMREQAELLVERDWPADLPPALCLHDPSWHEGVVGLVASRIRER